MSENPYQTPVPNPHTATSGLPADTTPGALKMLCIFCVILGALGLFGSVVGIGGLLFQQQLSEFQMDMAPPEQQEFQAKMAEAQSSFFIPNMFLAVCNLFVAPLLLVGGTGVLIKKRWGQKIFSFGLIAATIFVLVRLAVGSILQMRLFGVLKDGMLSQLPSGSQAGSAAAGSMETIMMTSMYVGVAFGVIMALGLAGFYFWGWRYLKKDVCQRYLNTFPA